MSFFRLFKPRGTAPVARERLQILLSHERAAVGPRDLVAILRDELLATIKRHVEIDPEKLSVKMDRSRGLFDARDRRRNPVREGRGRRDGRGAAGDGGVSLCSRAR